MAAMPRAAVALASGAVPKLVTETEPATEYMGDCSSQACTYCTKQFGDQAVAVLPDEKGWQGRDDEFRGRYAS